MGVSLAIHALLVGPLVLFAKPPEPIEFETVKVNLVSAPPAEMVQPEPAPPAPEPQPEPVPEPPPKPEPEPEAEAVEPEPEPPPEQREDIEKPPETPEAQPQPAEEPPDSAATTGGDNLNIATEGREFPFPEYLNNVIIQVNRYFRWDRDTRPVGVVYFEINSDGTVRNIRMVRPSGNIRFDYAVQGAVETAGNRGAFGPLPDGYALPTLAVQLEIEPPR